MFFKFLSQQLIEFWRGRNKAGSIVAKIVMLVLMIYLLLVAFAIGFFMKKMITKIFPGADIDQVFNGFILYYFMIDFLMRIQIQELPTISIKPYLTLNIRKKTIINFLNFKTLFSFFNIAPLFVFLPFCFTEIAGKSGGTVAFSYAVSIISLIIFNNFFGLWLKRQGNSKGWFLLTGILIVILLAGLDYLKVISVSGFSNFIFNLVAAHSYIAVAFVAIGVSAYFINSKYLAKNLYIEELTESEQSKVSTDYPFFNRFGEVGQLAANELKLILRNKRSKTALTMSFVFLFYGFIFYKKQYLDHNQFSMLLFAAIFITGVFQMIYGQFMYAWQSNHFDGLMANRINFTDFIKGKFLLFTLAGSIITLISLLYGFISWKLLLLHGAVYFYNIGFGSVIVLFFANFNEKRLNLSKSGNFNWQGVGATQWIMGTPAFGFPYLIYLPFGINNKPYLGLLAIGIFGLITLAMRDFWVKWLTKLFIKQRYKIAEGFRE